MFLKNSKNEITLVAITQEEKTSLLTQIQKIPSYLNLTSSLANSQQILFPLLWEKSPLKPRVSSEKSFRIPQYQQIPPVLREIGLIPNDSQLENTTRVPPGKKEG